MTAHTLIASISLVFFASTGIGCAAEATSADGSVTGDDQEITSRDTYKAIPIENAVYQSLAVVGDVAFVGDNNRTIDLVDLKRLKKTGTLPGRIVNDSMTASGGKVIACGLRDDSPIDPFDDTPAERSYVLTVIDAATKAVEGEVKLGIEGLLRSNPSRGFVNLPDLSCRFDAAANTMSVTFSQEELGREVTTFPMPALGTSVDYQAIPGATRTKLDAGTDRDTVIAAATSDSGITYAAGGYGLRRLAPGQTKATSLRDEGREHMVDLQIRSGRIYAVDHNGALVVADEATGETVERVEIPDYLHAIALTPTHVVVIGRGGIFVAKDRWRR
jgi:hypothetical protein